MNAHLDYLRIASWDYSAYPYLLSELMEIKPGDWQQSHWLQYAGWRRDELFMGHGEQNGNRHCVLHISGSQSHEMQSIFMPLIDWYATRIDVQVTIPLPELDLAKIHKSLGAKISTLISSEKNKTLYVGSRTSEVFTRLYEKPLDIMYLRLEFELKGNTARMVWKAIQKGKSVGDVFGYYLDKSKLPEAAKIYYRDADNNCSDLALIDETVHTAEIKLAWLQSLDASVMRAISDHEIGERVKLLVMSWANYASNLDIISDIE